MPEQIRFSTRNPFLLQDIAGPSIPTLSIDAALTLPERRNGPVPAVVLSQGLSGAGPGREHRYARLLAENGIASLVFDSFRARADEGRSDTLRALRVSEAMLLSDAFSALAWLAARPDIRADAVSILGFSYGGMISVLAAYRQVADLFLPGGPRFSRHVALYGCSIPRLEDPLTTGAPVTMLLGGGDRNVDIARTQDIADDLRRGGSSTVLTVFPDLLHQWDDADAPARRFVLLQLAGCRMRVGRDNRVTDERTGLGMTGALSRAAMIARSISLRGYHVGFNAAAAARSDAVVLEALGAGGALPVQPHPATAGSAYFGGLQDQTLPGFAVAAPSAAAPDA